MYEKKLVRNSVPDAARASSIPLRVQTATAEELPRLAVLKLVEETNEIITALPDQILGELADVMEVVHLIAHLHGHTPEDIEEVRQIRAQEKGTFDRGFVLENVEASTDSSVASDMERNNRHQALEHLMERVTQGVSTPGEEARFQELVRQEIRDSSTLRAVAAGNFSHVAQVVSTLHDAWKESS